jgi:hypothetical protein
MFAPQMMDHERSRTPFIAIPAPTAATRSAPVMRGAVSLLIFEKKNCAHSRNGASLGFFYFGKKNMYTQVHTRMA